MLTNRPSGRCIMAITSAFQAEDAGSIPAARSSKEQFRSCTWIFLFVSWQRESNGKRGREKHLFLPERRAAKR